MHPTPNPQLQLKLYLGPSHSSRKARDSTNRYHYTDNQEKNLEDSLLIFANSHVYRILKTKKKERDICIDLH